MEIQTENNKRLEVLFKNSNDWLMACAMNISKDKEIAEELVSELYLYLADKPNPSLWYLTSFNLKYCYMFLQSRFINRVKYDGRNLPLYDNFDKIDEEYNTSFDKSLEDAYDDVVEELKRLERTKLWASSKIAQMYFFNDFTLESLSKELGICKSTSFLNVKKVKAHLRKTIKNPFDEQ
jgi:DNA-directed RNA polymerase specialized sigma24 family protein